MTNTNDGSRGTDDRGLHYPKYSQAGNATCTNPKCKARIVKSNATMDVSERLYKALMVTNRTKIFIVEGAVVAECVCGTRYDMGGVFFEKTKK